MKSVFHQADTRGHANHGWLDSYHTFSFAGYHDPKRMNFGVLRVLNDDVVSPAMGFGTHAHQNMEIISIPLEGDLRHQDSMGNTTLIKQGDIQVMSAGKGIRHSEMNANTDRAVKFLQIWVIPNKHNVDPRYDQISLDPKKLENQLYQILSPHSHDQGVWIYQNAWFSLGNLEPGFSLDYKLHDPANGVYIFVIEGAVEINSHLLQQRDGLGVWELDQLSIEVQNFSRLLLMEVPMM